jgi:hypothetical protein
LENSGHEDFSTPIKGFSRRKILSLVANGDEGEASKEWWLHRLFVAVVQKISDEDGSVLSREDIETANENVLQVHSSTKR